MTPDRQPKHRPVDHYLAHIIANARRLTGVVAPGIWIGGQLDPAQTFQGGLRTIAIY